MNSLTEVRYVVRFETEAQNRDLQTRREQDRWAWWTAVASEPRRAKGPGIRQLAVRLGDFAAGLRCRLENRFAPEPAATAC